jgi:ATP-binding cassette subfamily C (CFTR/MRP) protein 4
MEIAQIIKANLLRITNFSFCLYLDKITIYFCVLTTLLTKSPLTAQYFFVLFNFFRNLNITVTKRLIFGLIYSAEAKSSLNRIEKFLLCEQQELQRFGKTKERYNQFVSNSLSTSCPPGLYIKLIAVKLGKNIILNDVSLTVFPGELTGIAGGAGSGKSALLQVILKEIEPTGGTVDVQGTLSFSPQEAWIFSASIRQNILFGQEMDLDKYQKVMRVCALEEDLSIFPHGDQTLVGERGVMLSGGQKARISLARAVYRDADIYLLDDPLSAVDAHVAEHIFNECILNHLKNKCVVLVTHQLKFLSKVNKAYFIENGKLRAGEITDKFKKLAYDNEIQTIALKKFDAISEVKEHRSLEANSQNMYIKYCFAGPWVMSLFVLFMLSFIQILNSGADLFVAFWLDLIEYPNHSRLDLSPEIFLYIYTILIIIVVVLIHLLDFFYVKYCAKISKKFHQALVQAILAVPIKFFNDHSSGRILNRFSKDMGCVDQMIPGVLFEVITIMFYVIGICVVISILNYWLILPTIGLILFFYTFAHFFKPINKSIRRTEGVGKFFDSQLSLKPFYTFQ